MAIIDPNELILRYAESRPILVLVGDKGVGALEFELTDGEEKIHPLQVMPAEPLPNLGAVVLVVEGDAVLEEGRGERLRCRIVYCMTRESFAHHLLVQGRPEIDVRSEEPVGAIPERMAVMLGR